MTSILNLKDFFEGKAELPRVEQKSDFTALSNLILGGTPLPTQNFFEEKPPRMLGYEEDHMEGDEVKDMDLSFFEHSEPTQENHIELPNHRQDLYPEDDE
jgi:hypothetical protein